MSTPLDRVDRGREADGHKGDNGCVLVVGGSARHVNTPGIVAGGALRVGVDTVTVAAPAAAAAASAAFHLNTMVRRLGGDRLQRGHVDTVLDVDADCVVIGPGLGRADVTREAVRAVLDGVDAAVVDADALHAIADRPSLLPDRCVLTPHAGEFAALTGEEPGDGDDRAAAVRAAADRYGCTVLLKGPVDVVSDGAETVQNETGTPQMTRGGTGDVLAGIVAGFVAQGTDAVDAAAAAAYVNGRAGEDAAAMYGDGFLLEEMLSQVSAVVSEQ